MRTRLPLVAAVVASLALANGCGGGSSGSQPPPAADFSIAVQPSSLSLVLGMSGPIQVTVSPENGFSGTVAVDTNSLPTGVTVTPALPQSVGTSGLTLKVAAASAATAGTYTLTFVGSSGNLQHSANLSLALTTPAPETIPGNRTNWVRLGSNPIAVYYDAPRNHVLTSRNQPRCSDRPNHRQHFVVDSGKRRQFRAERRVASFLFQHQRHARRQVTAGAGRGTRGDD